jgi:hypothetical protein
MDITMKLEEDGAEVGKLGPPEATKELSGLARKHWADNSSEVPDRLG